MRFCTPPSGVTMTSRTRRSDSRRNSTWRKVVERRGAMTTPAKRDRFDSRVAAVDRTRCGSSGWIRSCSASVSSTCSGSTTRSVSTKKRYPRGVGMRPADVCGLVMRPISSRSAITLRTVAGERSSPECRESVREPTGCPSAMYRSISVFRRMRARSSSMSSIVWAGRAVASPVPAPFRPSGRRGGATRGRRGAGTVCSNRRMENAFQRVGLIGRWQSEEVTEALFAIAAFLRARGVSVLVEERAAAAAGRTLDFEAASIETIGDEADLAIALGGDGTMLGAARALARREVPLVGINAGRLGFITDIGLGSWRKALTSILEGSFEAEERTLLTARVVRDHEIVWSELALNDVVVNRSSRTGMIELQVHVDDLYMYSQRADGLIIATPT